MRRSPGVLKHQPHLETGAATATSDGDRPEEDVPRLGVVIADDNEWVRDLVKNALEPYFAVDRSVGDGSALIAQGDLESGLEQARTGLAPNKQPRAQPGGKR